MAEDSYEWAAIIPIAGGEVKKLRMPVPASQFGAFRLGQQMASLSCTPEMKAESRTSGRCRSLVALPGESRTSIPNESIFAFDVSPENRLVISRGNWVSDVVLIKNVKNERAGRAQIV